MTKLDSVPATSSLQRACPICGGRDARLLHRQNLVLSADHPLATVYEDGYRAVLCERCAFAYADVTATQCDFDAYYTRHSKYDDLQTGTGGGGTLVDAARLQHTARDLAALIPDRTASILDIGCATGGLLHELQLLGFSHLKGLDPSPQSAVWARQMWNIPVATGGLFEHALTEQFDVVMASHVFEHLLDLCGAVQALSALVKPGSAAYIEVPDASRYAENVVAPLQDFNVEHINHFSLRALDLLLAPHGFRREEHGRKTFESAPGAPYPALWGWWRKSDAPTVIADEPDFQTHLQQYVETSCQMLRVIDEALESQLRHDIPIAVWGTGQLAMKLLAETALGQARIVCFIDANPLHAGHQLRGVDIVAPFEAASRLEEQWPILIASTIHQEAIARRIRDELKWPNPLITLR